MGLVVKAFASRAEDLGSVTAFPADLSEWSGHTTDLKLGTLVATLPAAWPYRVSGGTGRPDVSIQRLGETESSVCSFCLSVATRSNCVRRSVSEIHQHEAGTLSNQLTPAHTAAVLNHHP